MEADARRQRHKARGKTRGGKNSPLILRPLQHLDPDAIRVLDETHLEVAHRARLARDRVALRSMDRESRGEIADAPPKMVDGATGAPRGASAFCASSQRPS